MSYDLMVFDPSAAPTERKEFRRWYEQQIDHTGYEPDVLGSELRSWYFEIIQDYPPLNGPEEVEDYENPKVTDYEFSQSHIYACFAWSQENEAYRKVVDLAKKYAVGFFDVSGPRQTIWRPRKSGQFSVFYCFYATAESVPGDLPISIDLQKILTDLLPKLVSDSDFIGIEDAYGTTLQFLYDKQRDLFWMEIPSPQFKGSFGAHISRECLTATVQCLPAVFDPESLRELRELKFIPWDATEDEYD